MQSRFVHRILGGYIYLVCAANHVSNANLLKVYADLHSICFERMQSPETSVFGESFPPRIWVCVAARLAWWKIAFRLAANRAMYSCFQHKPKAYVRD